MADETWPSSLPQFVDRSSFTYTLSASSLSTSMSTGYDKRRRKFSGQYASYDVTMQCTFEQLDTFEQFFNNNLGYGVIDFDFPDPLFLTSTAEVRIKTGASIVPYTITPYGDSEDVVLQFVLEQLVSSRTTVTATEWPSTLPQCPIQDGYSLVTQSAVVRDENYTSGKIDVRRRFTAIIRSHSVVFLMSRAQLDIFFNFYYSLGYGSLSFSAPFPFDESQSIRARFDTSGGIGFSAGYYNETDTFEVSFIMEELPLLKDFS